MSAAAMRKSVAESGERKKSWGKSERECILFSIQRTANSLQWQAMKLHIAVLLHNVRSSHNVGSIFRTRDAAGVSTIFLSGYTPTPIDRFGRPQKDIVKTALGAEKNIPWKFYKTPQKLISKLKSDRWAIVGVEQDKTAVDYRKFAAKNKTLFIFGNEVLGISPGLRKLCDTLIEIPMHGKKESLNVSVAAGIVLFRNPNT